jgi:hypothetical protein
MPTPGAQSAAKPDHVVTLNYAGPPPTFTADPPSVKVNKNGETISFKLGVGPPNGKVRVTFSSGDRGRFSRPVFNDGDAPVTVQGKGAGHKTTYRCELLVDGKVVAASADAGGEVELPPGT